MSQEEQGKTIISGVVTEALSNTMFRVQFEEGNQIIVYLSGKMRMNRIKVLVGDRVTVELDQYGKKGRIIKRL